MVERNIRTLETFVKPFLLENNTLKQAVRRAIKLMRFSESVPLKMSSFEKLTGGKPRNRITNNLGLDNPDATLVTLVKSPNEQLLGSQRMDAMQLADFESSRTWGRSRNEQDLKRFVNHQVKNRKRKVRKFIVENNRKKSGWDSSFGSKPIQVIEETQHTVKIGNRTLHKRMSLKCLKKS